MHNSQKSASCFSISFVGVLIYDLTRFRYSSWSIFVRAYPTILMSLGRNWLRYSRNVSFCWLQFMIDLALRKLYTHKAEERRKLSIESVREVFFCTAKSGYDTHSLLLRKVAGGAEDHDDRAVLELHGTTLRQVSTTALSKKQKKLHPSSTVAGRCTVKLCAVRSSSELEVFQRGDEMAGLRRGLSLPCLLHCVSRDGL